jgi:hypothetical protein
MPYTPGAGQFGKSNLWATLKALVVNGYAPVNPNILSGFGPLQAAKATYDFSVDGGAVATIQLANSPTIPAGAIVLGGIIEPITTVTSGGAATIAVGVGSGAQTAAIKAATGFASFNALLSVLPIWTSGFFEVTADGKISITIAAATVTAGKFSVQIVYLLAGQ